MSSTIENAFITTWRNEVVHKFSRSGSLLRDTVTVYPGVTGKTIKVHRVGSVQATVGRPRHAPIPAADVPHDDIDITMLDIYARDYIDSLDMLKTNGEFRKNYTKELMDAVNRQIDQFIINSLNQASTTELSISNKLDSAGLITAGKALTNANVGHGNRMAAISPGGEEDLLTDTKFTSRDFVRNSWLEKGFGDNVLGFRLTTIAPSPEGGLPVPAGSQRRNFFYDKRAVALAIGAEPTLTAKFLDQEDAWMIQVKASVGSALVLPEGVFRASIAD
ncbi:phage capsid protein [Ferrovibrio sp.]|uniref:phage capsid protein n=1 Tax=Ferrovibrio sp. TaxID=1917215 RepID=UPI0035B44432